MYSSDLQLCRFCKVKGATARFKDQRPASGQSSPARASAEPGTYLAYRPQAADYLDPTPTADVATRVKFIRPDVLPSLVSPANGIVASHKGRENVVSAAARVDAEDGSPLRKKVKKSVQFFE